MKYLKYSPILLLILLLSLFSCKRNVNEDDDLTKAYSSTNCLVQKGPFVQGSSVVIQEFDDEFTPTGRSFSFETKDDFGSFDYNVELSSNYTEFIANGYYFNEVTGKIDGPITLRNVLDNSVDTGNNINVLTTLAKERIKYLILKEGVSFEDAKAKSEQELLIIFNIPDELYNSKVDFTSMDISKSGENNAILLAISSILQYDNTPGELSELISKISSDIRDDGILDNQSIINELLLSNTLIVSDSIINNLTKRYIKLGLSNDIPNIHPYLDKDGDMIINSYDFDLISPVSIINDSRPIIKWKQPDNNSEGKQYTFQISKSDSFELLLYEKKSIIGNSLILDYPLENNINYYWRLAFEDNTGNPSAWSLQSFIIQLANVNLTFPLNTTISNTKPTFEWNGITTDNPKYHIQLSDDIEFANLLIDESTLSTNSYNLTDLTLDNNKSYYWRVAYIDGNNVESDWSSSQFSIKLETVSITSPDKLTANTLPTIKWSIPSLSGVKYHLQILDGQDDTKIIGDYNDLSSNEFTLDNPLDDVIYIVRVSYYDKNNVQSDWSNEYDFHVSLPYVDFIFPLYYRHTAEAPTIDVLKPIFEWTKPCFTVDNYECVTPDLGDIKYTVQVTTGLESPDEIVFEETSLSTNYFESPKLPNGRQYFIRVNYIDKNGVTSQWSNAPFFIDIGEKHL